MIDPTYFIYQWHREFIERFAVPLGELTNIQ